MVTATTCLLCSNMRPALFLPFFLPFAVGATNTLNITVINAQDNASTLECWALEPGFQTSSQAGTSGTQALNLGPIGGGGTNASYTVLPAGFDGGRHNAPAKQYVYIQRLFSLFLFSFFFFFLFFFVFMDSFSTKSNINTPYYPILSYHITFIIRFHIY